LGLLITEFYMERTFKRDVDALAEVFALVSEFSGEQGLDDSTAYALNLAIEELFVNMVRHNPENPNDIVIDLSAESGSVTVSLTDFDVEPFDPTKFEPYDASRPLAERRPGGLGIHLVRSVMDHVSYEYSDGESRITLTKHLGKKDA
jgi:serine/threonine-protein kinase RsbW